MQIHSLHTDGSWVRVPKISSESSDLKFARLSSDWKRASAHLSAVERMAMLPSYQAIIGMGPEVVPLLLQDLQQEPCHWFWALHAITQENPAENKGPLPVSELAALWIEWGRQKGLI